MTTNAEYQRRERVRRKEQGDVFIHVAVSKKAKSQLDSLAASMNLTQRGLIEMLLDVAHKELLK